MIILDKIKQIGNMVMSIFGFRKEKSLNPASTELTHDEEQGMIEGKNIPKSIIDKTIKAFYTSKSQVLDASGVSQEKAKKINQLLDRVYDELPTEDAKKDLKKTRDLYITGLESEMNNPLAYIPEEYKPEVDKLERTQKDKLYSDILERDNSHRLYVIKAVLGSEAIKDQSFFSLKEQYIDELINNVGMKVILKALEINESGDIKMNSQMIHNKFNKLDALGRRQLISEIISYSQQQQQQQQQPRHNFVKEWYSTEKPPDEIDQEAQTYGNDNSSNTIIPEDLGDEPK